MPGLKMDNEDGVGIKADRRGWINFCFFFTGLEREDVEGVGLDVEARIQEIAWSRSPLEVMSASRRTSLGVDSKMEKSVAILKSHSLSLLLSLLLLSLLLLLLL